MHRGPLDPSTLLSFRSHVHLFLSVVSISHTNAGVLTIVCLIFSCAAWPTTLNTVPLATLLVLLWRWACPRAAAYPPHPQPLLTVSAANTLACWTAAQLVCSYLLQIPQLAHTAAASAARALNVGLFSCLSTFQEEVLLSMHLLALAVLFLVLNGTRCTSDGNARHWPSVDDITSAAGDRVNAHVQARQHQAAAEASAAATQRSNLLSPIMDRWPSGAEPNGFGGVLRPASPALRDVSGGELPQWLDPTEHPPEWIWVSGQVGVRPEEGRSAQRQLQSGGARGHLNGMDSFSRFCCIKSL